MTYNLYNACIKPITVKCNHLLITIQPGTITAIDSDNDEISIELCHTEDEKLNILWYILNELFTLEQMKTVLIVDGKYTIKSLCDSPLIKIKDYEYVFEKYTSYQTYIFASNESYVIRDRLQVKDPDKIIKKSKYLYLFGGDKTLFPIIGIATVVSTVKIAFMSFIPTWYWIMSALLWSCFLWFGSIYIKSLKSLQKAMSSDAIMEYMLSERKEYRNFSDDLVQKNLDINADDDVYW